jgi:hypothetical protein
MRRRLKYCFTAVTTKAAPLYDQRLPLLRYERAIHYGQGTPDHAMGA